MTAAASLLLIVSADDALVAGAETILARHDWRARQAADRASARGVLESLRPAVVLVDQRFDEADEIIAEIRQLAVPLNGTPVLTIGGGAERGAQLELPLVAAELLRLLRQRAGPLDDHALRHEPWNARYKLTRLVGLDGADDMLRRLRGSLADAVGATDCGDAGESISAHRLAGLAGICGFAELSRAWSRVDRQEDGAIGGAIAASHDAMGEIDRAL